MCIRDSFGGPHHCLHVAACSVWRSDTRRIIRAWNGTARDKGAQTGRFTYRCSARGELVPYAYKYNAGIVTQTGTIDERSDVIHDAHGRRSRLHRVFRQTAEPVFLRVGIFRFGNAVAVKDEL